MTQTANRVARSAESAPPRVGMRPNGRHEPRRGPAGPAQPTRSARSAKGARMSRQMVMTGSAGRLAALLLLLALVVLASGCAAQSNPGAAPAADAQPTMHLVHVVRHGWHSGIVVRAADVPEHAWPARREFIGAEYLEVGWGDRAYYPDTRSVAVARAARTAVADRGRAPHGGLQRSGRALLRVRRLDRHKPMASTAIEGQTP